jgi:spermidine synthase
MDLINRIFLLLYVAGIIGLTTMIGSHFHDFHLADLLGSVLFCLVIWVAMKWLFPKNSTWISKISVVLIFTLPFLIQPISRQVVLNAGHSWYFFFLLPSSFIPLLWFARKLRIARFSTIGVVLACYLYAQTDLPTSQSRYAEMVVVQKQTRQGNIDITQWKNDFWIYYNDQLQFSTIDEHIYSEAFVHPVMSALTADSVLIIGGDNRLIEKELSRYDELRSVTVVTIDPEYRELMTEFTGIGPLPDSYEVQARDPFQFLRKSKSNYDVIFLDIPDPDRMEYAKFYTVEFFELCKQSLDDDGWIITQAGDITKSAFVGRTIGKTLQKTGLVTYNYDQQIPTIGQWSWIMGTRQSIKWDPNLRVDTRWINQEIINTLLYSGKAMYYSSDTGQVNTMSNLAILRNDE